MTVLDYSLVLFSRIKAFCVSNGESTGEVDTSGQHKNKQAPSLGGLSVLYTTLSPALRKRPGME